MISWPSPSLSSLSYFDFTDIIITIITFFYQCLISVATVTMFTTITIIITIPVTPVFVSLFLSPFLRLHVFPPPLLPLSLLFLSLTTYPITGPKYICRRYLNLVTFPTLITLILLPNLHIIVSRNFACKRTHAPTCICNRASESNWCL